ncbi:hypothetical protein C8A00DRAFT_13860 [Chaetomidium leptoderma]|uniref:Uncharacterized protein n=1 Tax=Chaetomidium leptoderma TaxID=669021 RepID=A0AAN6VNY2_9PEZI|nr:hypothetical protein C8A00DRAFT_13860 [Chaetomidium leptoderma]
MPRKDMTSPAKRRPAPGTGAKGASVSVNGPRSPPRAPRPSPSSTRSGGSGGSGGNNSTTAPSSSTFIAPPPRAALSRASSPAPAPDNPRNNSPHLTPGSTTTGTTRSPSPSPLGTSTTGPPATAAATTTALIATCQSALREKDVRIASLERELALMESEFHRELDKLSSAESDTAAFWQGKCAALERQVVCLQQQQQQQQTTTTATVGVGYNGHHQDWEGEDGEQEDGEEQEEEGIEELRVVLGRARDALERKDREVADLTAQVRGLKEWVSVSTRADGQAQTSDEVFGEGMARLGNGLQNWVLVNFRRTRVGEGCWPGRQVVVGWRRLTAADLSSADQDAISELARLVPMYEELASTSRIHLLQSVVSRVLVELVFDAYFVGLPDHVAGQIKQTEAFLSSSSSPESVNQWRSLTLTMLKKDASEKLQAETAIVVDRAVSKVNNLLDALTHTKPTEGRDQGLQALVTSAIELSRLLAVQKAVFRVEMPEILPHQRIMFDLETMEDIGGEDEDSLADREICCVAFPGIIKRGDESGGHLQYRNVISKAKVLCSPE